MANNTLARALVALKLGFRTRFNTGLSKCPSSLPFTLPMTAPEHCSRVKGHTQDRLSSQGTQRSLTCILSLGPALGLWKKDPRQPGVLAWTKHSTPHRKSLSRDFDPEPFFSAMRGSIFESWPSSFLQHQARTSRLDWCSLYHCHDSRPGKKWLPLIGEKTWNHAESCQIVSLAGHAKSGG